jgi:hypothetical protein
MYVQRPSMGMLMLQKPLLIFILCDLLFNKSLEAFYRLMLD